jgi:YHS domain-containing protein
MNQPTNPPDVPPSANMAPLALDGYCPVELVENKAWKVGDRRWGATHQGRTYLFTGPEQQRRFLDAPERYCPVNAGNDVVLALDEGQAVPGRREHGVFYGSRIYLFASEDSLEAFSRQPARYETAIQRAAQTSPMGNYR